MAFLSRDSMKSIKKPLETNKLFSLQKVKVKLFSLERDKNKIVFRTKTQKRHSGEFLDISVLCQLFHKLKFVINHSEINF